MKYFKIVYFFVFCLILFALVLYGCREDITGEFNPNQPPETYIFVSTAETDTLNFQPSVQTLHWDGRDPDGFVKGYYYTWQENPAENDWIWTTERSLLFPLKIEGTDTIYIFQIAAVDNKELRDPSPAAQVFPIINSPPLIDWTINSRIPDTTFTVASFLWAASDPDGDSTIAHFEYALDSPENWRKISGVKRSLTINPDSGLSAGDHVFFMRAVDIAGATSNIIQMPEGTTWHVKIPQGNLLLIDDYQVESSTSGTPDAYYKGLMTEILPEIGATGGFEYWNIEELFPASRVQFIETMKLFERVIWYSDLITETDEHFISAQIAIPEYLNSGGKIIYTVQFNTGFGSQGSPLEFSPIDSLGSSYNVIVPSSSYFVDPEYESVFSFELPALTVSKFIFGVIALQPKLISIPMYRYNDPALEDDPIFIVLGQNDNKIGQDRFDFVFSGTPLHMLNGSDNLDAFFTVVLRDIFTVN